MTKDKIEAIASKAPDRRRFLQSVGLASAALAGASSLARAQSSTTTPSFTDTDILNFALNLEYLEAEFYTVAVTGLTLEQSGFDVGGTAAGPTTGGQQVNFANQDLLTGYVATAIMNDEQEHVTFLRTALGSAAIPKPAINLNALGIGFNDEVDFLAVSRALEDTGVTAYAGAAPLLTNPTYVGAAARILATEAEHSGNIRLQVALLRNSIAGFLAPLDPKDILPPTAGNFTAFFPVNSMGLVETRTVPEVLYIVYGMKSGVTSGGFFPKGINGYFSTTPSQEATALD